MNERIPFWKMHGTGNDFVLVEAAPGDRSDAQWSDLATRICDRHFGVGADGLILVLPSDVASRRMRIINADGSEAEMCGNGVRCFVRYCIDRGLVDAPDGRMTIEAIPGVLQAEVTRGAGGEIETVRVSMGVPDLDPSSVGVAIEQPAPVTDLPITVSDAAGEETVEVTLVSMGNPHAVALIDGDPAAYDLHRIGPLVEHHAMFANRTNYEVVQVIDERRLSMRVWERGVGETLACGSGACAAAVAARLRGATGDDVQVAVPGGTLRIEWSGEGEVYLSGPATFVFEAEWGEGAK